MGFEFDYRYAYEEQALHPVDNPAAVITGDSLLVVNDSFLKIKI
ncbi:hypothetical protein GCM10027199_86690 [Amycolatopsis magusensis]